MTKLRLVADDLTGALDSAAQFAAAGRAVPVFPGPNPPAVLPGAFAVDAASREGDAASAAGTATRLAPLLAPLRGAVSFKKVDSLLRGHPGIELAATLQAISAVRCLIAPAFPHHGRVTRGGIQFARRDGSWHRVGEDLGATLKAKGISVRLVKAGDSIPLGVSLWDAETDEELRCIARSGDGLPEPALWCGTGGLAAALSPTAPLEVKMDEIGRPMLGVLGSDHPVTHAQIGACGDDVHALRDGASADLAFLMAALEANGVCLVRFELPSGVARPEAAARIARSVFELARRVAQPRCVLAVGGETLRALCHCLGTVHLAVMGQLMPGVPVSRMVGGRWDGTEVVSKSGAFGDDALLRRIALRRQGGAA